MCSAHKRLRTPRCAGQRARKSCGEDPDRRAAASRARGPARAGVGAGPVAERDDPSRARRRSRAPRRGGGRRRPASASSSRAGTRRPSSGSISSASMPSRAARKRFSERTSCGIDRSMWSSPSTSSADDRLDQGGDRGGVAERRLGVHDPHLDRAEARLRAHVPPEEGRLRDRVAADQHVDRLDVLGVVGEGARDADPREGLEERRAGRGEAGVAALPEGRVDRERQQQRDVGAEAVGGVDRRFGVGHADVDVEAEGRLAPGQLAHRAVDELVALAGRDDDLLPDREGVGAGAGGPHRERLQGLVELGPQRRQLLDRLADPRVDAGLDLERRAVGLGGEAVGAARGGGGAGRCRSGGRAPR